MGEKRHVVVYGIGGFIPELSNNNMLEEYDLEETEPDLWEIVENSHVKYTPNEISFGI